MNKLPSLRALVPAVLLAPSANVWAHPGHGDEMTLMGLLHLLEPMHLLPVMSFAALALVLRRLLRRCKDSRVEDKA